MENYEFLNEEIKRIRSLIGLKENNNLISEQGWKTLGKFADDVIRAAKRVGKYAPMEITKPMDVLTFFAKNKSLWKAANKNYDVNRLQKVINDVIQGYKNPFTEKIGGSPIVDWIPSEGNLRYNVIQAWRINNKISDDVLYGYINKSTKGMDLPKPVKPTVKPKTKVLDPKTAPAGTEWKGTLTVTINEKPRIFTGERFVKNTDGTISKFDKTGKEIDRIDIGKLEKESTPKKVIDDLNVNKNVNKNIFGGGEAGTPGWYAKWVLDNEAGRIKQLFIKVTPLNNFYLYLINFKKSFDTVESIRQQNTDILNKMFSVFGDSKIKNKDKEPILNAFREQLISNATRMQKVYSIPEGVELEAKKLYDQIVKTLENADIEKYPNAKNFLEYLRNKKGIEGTALDELENVIIEINKIKDEGSNLIMDIIPLIDSFKKKSPIQIETRGGDITGQSLKEYVKGEKSLLSKFLNSNIVDVAINNARYGISTKLNRLKQILMRYGYIRGSLVIYVRLLIIEMVIIPALETLYQICASSIVLGLDIKEAAGIFALAYPGYWGLSSEEKEIFKTKFIDELNTIFGSGGKGFGEQSELINKIIENLSNYKNYIPILGDVWNTLEPYISPWYDNEELLKNEKDGLFNPPNLFLIDVPKIVEIFSHAIGNKKGFEYVAAPLKQKLIELEKEFNSDYNNPLNQAQRKITDNTKKDINDNYVSADNLNGLKGYLNQNVINRIENFKNYLPLIDTNPNVKKEFQNKPDNENISEKLEKAGVGLYDRVNNKWYPLIKLLTTTRHLDKKDSIRTDIAYKKGRMTGYPFNEWYYIQKDNLYYGIDKVTDVISKDLLNQNLEKYENLEFDLYQDQINNILNYIGEIQSSIEATNTLKRGYEKYKNKLSETKSSKIRYKETIKHLETKISEIDGQVNDLINKGNTRFNEIDGIIKDMEKSKSQNLIKSASEIKSETNEKREKFNNQNSSQEVTKEHLTKTIKNLIKEMEEGKKFGEDNFKHWKDTFKFKKYDEKTNQLKDVKITAKMDEIMDRVDHFRKKYDEDDSFVRAVIDVYGAGIDIIQYTKGLAHLTEGVIVGGLLGVLSTIRESKELVTWTVKHYNDGNWELVKGNFNKKELLNVGKTKRESDERQKESENPAEGLKKKELESIMVLKRDEKEGLNGIPTKVKEKIKEKLRQGWTTETPFEFLSRFYTESEINSVFNEKIKIYKLKPSLEFFRTLAKNSSKINLKKGFCKSLKNAEIERDISQREKNVLQNFISKCETKFGV